MAKAANAPYTPFTHLTAMLATSDESSPPDSSTPSGASDMRRFMTLEMRVSCGDEVKQARVSQVDQK